MSPGKVQVFGLTHLVHKAKNKTRSEKPNSDTVQI